MKYIALEEAFSVPDLADRQPPPWSGFRFSQRHLADWARKLPDFTDYRLPEMDAAGIDVQVLSLTVPGLQADIDAPTARDDARLANDYLARVVADRPDRFRGFAALPMQDPKAAAGELGRCVRELGFCGALVNDHLQGRGDRRARAAHHLRRVFDRHPGATLILGHMGEFLPFMRSRLDSRYLTLDPEAPLQRMPSAYIGSNVVITTSGVFSPAALTGAVVEIGANAVMFSVDYPYESSHEAVAGLERTTLSDTDREKIAHGNAERILRL